MGFKVGDMALLKPEHNGERCPKDIEKYTTEPLVIKSIDDFERVYFEEPPAGLEEGISLYAITLYNGEPRKQQEFESGMKTAADFLQSSIETQAERAKIYDSPAGERSMGKTVLAFNAITGRDLTESQGWLFMQILKDVRQFSNKKYHEDSALDCVSYAALKAESLAKENHE